jgi:Prolyl oligopeptidase, N-terminal beta-propeller domain
MLSEKGSDWKTIKLLKVAADGTTTELPDVIEYVKFSGVSWSIDGLGFFYSGCGPWHGSLLPLPLGREPGSFAHGCARVATDNLTLHASPGHTGCARAATLRAVRMTGTWAQSTVQETPPTTLHEAQRRVCGRCKAQSTAVSAPLRHVTGAVCRYDKPEDTSDLGTETESATNHKLFYHRLGTPQEADSCLFANPDEPTWLVSAHALTTGRWLWVTAVSGCEPTNMAWVVDLDTLPQASDSSLDFGALAQECPGASCSTHAWHACTGVPWCTAALRVTPRS